MNRNDINHIIDKNDAQGRQGACAILADGVAKEAEMKAAGATEEAIKEEWLHRVVEVGRRLVDGGVEGEIRRVHTRQNVFVAWPPGE